MKSIKHGNSTLTVELSNVSPHGFWLLIGARELFLSFKDFPWFADVTIRDLAKVELLHPTHVYWPVLDIDLEVETIEHPERYPLVSAMQRAAVCAERRDP